MSIDKISFKDFAFEILVRVEHTIYIVNHCERTYVDTLHIRHFLLPNRLRKMLVWVSFETILLHGDSIPDSS